MSERIGTRSSKRQSAAAANTPKTSNELPPLLDTASSSQSKNQTRNELNVEDPISNDLYSTSKVEPPILEAEQTILVDGSSSAFTISPPYDEEQIRGEMAQKEPQYVARQMQNAVKDPFIYYSIREYVVRKKGTVDNLLQMVRENEPHFNITRRIVEQHLERNTVSQLLNIHFFKEKYFMG